ncbi:APC family permease [Mycolicibacterium setense]
MGAPAKSSSEAARGGSAAAITGNLGVGSIFFSVVAWAAPLLVVVGLMPSIVGFAGDGIVAGFAATTLILLLFSVGYTAITRYVERPGAFYAYISAGLGREAGLGGAFVAVFAYLMLVLSTWVAFGVFMRQLITDTLHGPSIPWYAFSVLGALVAGAMSYLTIEFSAKALIVALLLEVAVVVVFNTCVFTNGGPDGIATAPFTWSGVSSGNFGLAVLYAALCFIGFESAAIYREEAKNPEVTVSRATYLAVIVIGVFYLVSAWALLTALGQRGVDHAKAADVSTMFDDLTKQYVGSIIPQIVTVLVITSTFACLLASHNAVARYGYSLGKDGVLPSRFGQAHNRFRSPHRASVIVTVLELIAIAVIAAATGFDAAGTDAFTVYIRMNGLGAIAVVFLMCVVSIAVLGYFRRNRALAEGKLWKTVVAPALGLVGLLMILVLALQNVGALIGASTTVSMLLTVALPVVFAGGFCYARRLRSSKPAVYQQIGRQQL